MRMKPILAMLLGAALLPISACSGYDIPEEAPAPAQGDASNPFEEAQDDASLMAMLATRPPIRPCPTAVSGSRFPTMAESFAWTIAFLSAETWKV